MKDHFICLVYCGLLLAATGCAEESPRGNGDLLAQESGPIELDPALVFEWNGGTVILDGGITGTFPERFRLTSLPPPPAEMMMPNSDPRFGVTQYAVASIAAVARGRIPSLFPRRLFWSWTCGETREQGCVGRSSTCGTDRLDCAKVEIHCDILDKNCTITAMSGNLTLLRSNQRQLEGRVTDHALLYLAADVPARSLLSQEYGGGAALAAGYHLIQPRVVSKEDVARHTQCEQVALSALRARYGEKLGRSFKNLDDLLEHLIVTRFNERYGTTHDSIEDFRNSEDPRYHALSREIFTEFEEESVREQITQQCYLHLASHTVIGTSGSRELSMTLAAPFPKVGDFFPDGPPFDGSKLPLDWPWF